jgi:hypothetical protein
VQINDINQAIMHGNFTSDQLNAIVMAVKFARNQLGNKLKRRLAVGDTVEFDNSRRGYTMRGQVVKVAIKFVTVNCGANNGQWRVPAHMLRQI